MSRCLSTMVLWALCLCPCAFGQTGSSESGTKPTPEQASDADGENVAEDQKGPLAGHSYHGEVFNEGPRQAAYLMGNVGNVSFPVSTENAVVQKFVNQGVAQLHGFWYFEAERSFRQAASIEPGCAMAYWGMAMANTSNKDRAKKFIKEAVKRKSKASPREKMYIDALNDWYANDKKDKSAERAEKYTDALEKILYKYPDDLEARAFLGLQLWLNRRHKVKITSHLAVDALLQQVLAKNPRHPCHHYVIHLWDHEKAEYALKSASLCGQSAPGIAHMWHMPGHIYSDLQRYEDAVYQQEASARVDHAHMMRDQVLPDQISNFAHNNEWLIRNLIKLGRVDDALSLARNMIELPRHPKYNHFDKRGSANYGRKRLFDILNTFELWDETIALAETPSLEPTDKDAEQIKRLRNVGRAWFRKGETEKGREYLTLLEERLAEKEAEKKDAVEAAEAKAREDKKDEKAVTKAGKDAGKKFTSPVGNIRNAIREMEGHVAMAEDRYKDAIELFKKCKVFPAEFRAEVELAAGRKEAALKTAEGNVDKKKNEVRPLAALVEIRWKLGKRKEAREAFDRLRKISGSIDNDLQVFDRLTPIAKELGYPDEWRVARSPSTDVGDRPPLESLGPFRWRPHDARSWTLTDAEGMERSLADYKGKPLVVIFYLGAECLHCVEQMHEFAPKTKAFREAGFEIVGISSEDPLKLREAWNNYTDGFPFPLMADPELKVFRDYRAYDDFEKQPLHGTFLIDGSGRVRWHDISYEPFMKSDFLLKEGLRLLGQQAPSPVPSIDTAAARRK